MHTTVDAALLKNYIASCGLKYKNSSRSYIFTCPDPSCQKADKLYIQKSDGAYICWVCGNRGRRPEYVLSELLQIPVNQVAFGLYGTGEIAQTKQINASLGDEDFEYIDDRLVSLKPAVYEDDFCPINDPRAEKGAAYLAGRGIPLDIAMGYRIMYSPLQKRVVFPAFYDGLLYGWQARTIVPGLEPRMLNMKALEGGGWRSQMVMFMDRLKGSSHAVLTEGPLDCLKATLCGGNVCTMGKQVSPLQISIIRRMGIKNVYLALDPDAADKTAELVKDLTSDLKCYLIEPPKQYKDIGEMSFEDVFHLFKEAPRINVNRIFAYIKPWKNTAI